MRHFTYAISIVTCVSAVASAQTTVAVSGSPAVQDTTIRGGAFAATNFDGGLLATKLSSNATYIRHALVDFDTGTTIPAKSGIQSATLTLTVHSGGPQPLRTIGVYPVTRGFTDREATWDTATVTTPWTTAGGDLGPRAAAAAVPNTPGQHATFDVTSLVQAVVASTGSRHTRLALVDVDSLTSAAEGYRDYYSTEALDATQRPTLTIVYGRPATMVPNFSHVFVIVMENREYTDVIENPAAPYINRLANHYALATNYTAVAHPSLPDYMALTSGDTFFTTDCSGCIVDIKNVPSDSPDKTDIDVHVEEQSTGQISFGLGYSTSQGPLGSVVRHLRRLTAAASGDLTDTQLLQRFGADHDEAAGPSDEGETPRRPAEPGPRRSGEERPDAVADQGDHH